LERDIFKKDWREKLCYYAGTEGTDSADSKEAKGSAHRKHSIHKKTFHIRIKVQEYRKYCGSNNYN
jgi:hypothetical protein